MSATCLGRSTGSACCRKSPLRSRLAQTARFWSSTHNCLHGEAAPLRRAPTEAEAGWPAGALSSRCPPDDKSLRRDEQPPGEGGSSAAAEREEEEGRAADRRRGEATSGCGASSAAGERAAAGRGAGLPGG